MRSLLVGLVLAMSASSAAADGLYVTESVGGVDVKSELGEQVDNATRVKLSVGYRFGSFALEGFFGVDIGNEHASDQTYAARCVDCGGGGGGGYDGGYYRSPPSLVSMGLDLKYIKPITQSRKLEVYLRGTLAKGWLEDTRSGAEYSGRGLGVGAGLQLKGKVPVVGFLFWPLFFTNWGPKVTAAAFIDTGADYFRLHRNGDFDSGSSIDARMTRFTVGWAVGGDF